MCPGLFLSGSYFPSLPCLQPSLRMLRTGNLIRTVALKLGCMEVRPRSLHFSLALCDLYFESPCVRLKSLSFVNSIHQMSELGAGGLAQQLRANTTLVEDLSSVPSTHTVWLTLNWSSSFRRSALPSVLRAPFFLMLPHPGTLTHTQLKIILKKNLNSEVNQA